MGIYIRLKNSKEVNVAVVDKDGTKRVVTIKKGRNPEVDQFISALKKSKGNK